MRSVRVLAVVGLAALAAGCSAAPSYYADRVSDRGSARTAQAEAPRARTAAAPSRRSTARREHQNPSATVAAPAPAAENVGAAAPTHNGAETREERERRAAVIAERREEALKRSINSICRGC